MMSPKIEATIAQDHENMQPTLRHPSFLLEQTGTTFLISVSFSKERAFRLEEFYLLHQETNKRYPMKVEKLNDFHYSFSVDMGEFIKLQALNDSGAHFDVYVRTSYITKKSQTHCDEPLSLSQFEQFNSKGLAQVLEEGYLITPYFSKEANHFGFTVNLPLTGTHYIKSHTTDKVHQDTGNLTVSGCLETLIHPVSQMTAFAVGRKNNNQRFNLDCFSSSKEGKHALYSHSYDLTVNLKQFTRKSFVHGTEDEDYDLYLEVHLKGLLQPTILPVSKPKKLPTMKRFKESAISYGKYRYLLAPTSTSQYSGLTLSMTKFEKKEYEYLRELLPFSRLLHILSARKDIWIVGEKPMEARGNGWHFYKYMRLHHPDKQVYYVLDPASPDYSKVAELGEENLLPFKSKKYIQLLLRAHLLLTTEAPYEIFPNRSPVWDQFFPAKRVLLQKDILGIRETKEQIGFLEKNFRTDLILISSKTEKRYVTETLNYPEKQIALTGLSRFDELLQATQKISAKNQLLILPASQEIGLHQSEVNHLRAGHFLSLLDHPQFQKLVAEKQLDVVMALPPSMLSYVDKFAERHCLLVLQDHTDLLKLAKESQLLITDTDAFAVDFSFLKKPVFFFQPETHADEIAPSAELRQTYLNELPGEIASTTDQLIHLLWRSSHQEFKINRKNRQKADALLQHHDTSSNERIYTAVSKVRPAYADISFPFK